MCLAHWFCACFILSWFGLGFCLVLFWFGCLVVGAKNTECKFVYDRFFFACLIAWLLLLCVWLIGFVRVLFCLGLVWVYLLGEGKKQNVKQQKLINTK